MTPEMRFKLGIFCIVLFHVLNGHLCVRYSKSASSTSRFSQPNSHYRESLPRRYLPTWQSLDQRPLPAWYEDSKIGIFLHWGVYSVPAFHSEWFWYYWRNQSESREDVVQFMKKNYPPDFVYANFASNFKAELWDPEHWANVFARSGAKYIVLTSKHHDGFALWPNSFSFNWNSMDVGPKRDLVGDLAKAVRKEGLHFGLYHSLFEWFNPIYLRDRANNFATDQYVTRKALPEMVELVENYKPEVIWSDGDWGGNSTYWKSKEFLAWLFNDSPVKDTIVVNDRWGEDAVCKHGSFLNCEDRYDPKEPPKKKWENAMTLDRKSWGWRREAVYEDFYKFPELLKLLVRTIARGGNFLMNIGPNADGTLSPIFEERLSQLGEWLKYRGRAIYETRPAFYISETIWTTKTKDSVCVFILDKTWNPVKQLILESKFFKTIKTIRILNESMGELVFVQGGGTLKIQLPDDIDGETVPVIEIFEY